MSALDNEALAKAIDRCVRGEIARAMLKRRLIDEITVEKIAEEFFFSDRQTKRILSRAKTQLINRL
ncbi:MAG: hypothetical protein IKY59_07365 [Oscillospiraceae bacterium]|nr:hypothetical protein [Oscillospiraceae bacterium]